MLCCLEEAEVLNRSLDTNYRECSRNFALIMLSVIILYDVINLIFSTFISVRVPM